MSRTRRPHPAWRARRAVAVGSVGAAGVLGLFMAADALVTGASVSAASSDDPSRSDTPTTAASRDRARSATPSTTAPRRSAPSSRSRAS